MTNVTVDQPVTNEVLCLMVSGPLLPDTVNVTVSSAVDGVSTSFVNTHGESVLH